MPRGRRDVRALLRSQWWLAHRKQARTKQGSQAETHALFSISMFAPQQTGLRVTAEALYPEKDRRLGVVVFAQV